jgi:hypothetical protein
MPNDNLPDGSLLELINLRFSNGALRPIPEKTKVAVGLFPQFDIKYKHLINDETVAYWGLSSGSLAYAVYENDSPVYQNLSFMSVTGNLVFSTLGNSLLVSDDILEKTFVMLFQPDSHTYRSFDKFIPDMPLITFRSVAKNTDDELGQDLIMDQATMDQIYILCDSSMKGRAQDMFKRKAQKGYFSGRYMIRCAWELFDGSIVMHTLPQTVMASDISGMLHDVGPGTTTNIQFTGMETQFNMNIPSATLTAIKSQYAGIVKSFNIYMTNHQPLTELSSRVMWPYHDVYYSMTNPLGYTISSLNSWIQNEIFYYKVASIGIDSLIAETWTMFGLSDTSLLSSGEIMPAGNLSLHQPYGKSLFGYNQRVFLGNIKNTLFKGTSLYGGMFPGSYNVGGDLYSIGYSFDLDTVDGTRRVFTGWEPINFYRDSSPDYYQYTIHDTCIGYPDARAKKWDIWHKDDGGVIRHLYSIPLIQVFGMNFSYVIPALVLPLDLGVGYPKVSKLNSLWDVLAINENSVYNDGDRIQACEFQNPFYYPAANSYRVDGIVLGMATNAVPLGASQFGKYPIFAFTKKGIWAMNIGNGDVLIDSITPLSGTVCNSAKSILGIDGGVIFMSKEGLMILSGKDPVSISDMIIGSPTSPLADMLDYEESIDNPNTYQPKTFLSSVPFETYSINANIAFVIVNATHGVEKEIIISNASYPYSYVYNIMTKSWHKITKTWSGFVRDYPNTYAMIYELAAFAMYDMSNEVYLPDQSILVHLETRPIKFGEEVSFKKIMRTLLYGWIHPGTEDPFTFLIFGTADGRKWFTEQASNIITPGQKVAIGRTSFSARDFIIVMGGNIHDDSYISGIISDVQKRYNKKLT